jgi:TPR repeat protein
MKRMFTSAALGLSLLVASGGAVIAQDLDKGRAAYSRGEYAKALRELQPLAAQGVAEAQSDLGFMYFKGHGVSQDDVYAHMWWNIAASSGDVWAARKRDTTALRMTANDISKAQGLARACVAKKYKGC